ncbi:hypothetical protein MLD38_023363 [Melastoma candidum]|uniref:Uncharacterized protein n=1 Tax=Melastoma candidum TaxID=119954 RepID=A0ACB9QLF1_9MYRT|nr:hypothetical protein MLD38_023363 [Melastoma candidum]
MEEEGIGVVLARATELRLKISNCVHQASTDEQEEEEGGVGVEEERLLGICNAFEALESQLSSLQMLQQNHRYECEVALVEINCSRKMLLDKLKGYKGNDLEVIQEASLFAGENVEDDTNLLLPPYPACPLPHLLNLTSPRESIRNGITSSGPLAHVDDSEEDRAQDRSSTGTVGSVSKAVVAVLGIIAVLSLATSLRSTGGKNNNGPLRDLWVLLGSIIRRRSVPGRVLVMESGEARCLAPERVEVPFESVVATKDVNYWCG